MCLCQFLLTNTIDQAKLNFKGRQVTCWKDCAVTVQVEETRAVSACPTQELTKFRFWSSCLWDDLNVTRVPCPSSWFMKTLCLESTLHIMLSRPIGPCIRKNRWTAGILSMLVRNVEQPWLSVGSWCRDLILENTDFWRMEKESWWRVTVTASVWAFRSFLPDYRRSFPQLRRHLLGSFAKAYCKGFCGFWFWILQHPTCLSPHPSLILVPYSVIVSGCFR